MVEIILEEYEVRYFFDAVPKKIRDEIIPDRGKSVFLQGDIMREMFALLDEKRQLQRHTKAGVMVIAHTARTGEIFSK